MFNILYGSQTGQAKSIAEDLYNKLKTFNKSVNIFELDEIEQSYEINKLHYAVIICSTTGDGDAPDNASKFLRKVKLYPLNFLENLKYTVLGLGDTNYSNFCNCGKLINQTMKSLGANIFYKSEWADDALGLEITVEPWLEGLYECVQEIWTDIPINEFKKVLVTEISTKPIFISNETTNFLLGDHLVTELKEKNLTVPSLPQQVLNIVYNRKETMEIDVNTPLITSMPMPSSNSELLMGELIYMEKITKPFSKKPVHRVEIKITDCNWKWKPGDSVGVLPCNSPIEVGQILSRLGVSDSDRHCSISFTIFESPDKRKSKFPEHLIVKENSQMSLTTVLMWLCDIRQPLSKAALRVMSEYCPPGGVEQRRLLEMCSREGQSLYLKCMREASMPLLDLLNWFPNCQIPIDRIIELLPRLKPRAYSLCDLERISFAYSKVDIAPLQNFRKRPLTGVCTTWLDRMTLDYHVSIPHIPVYLRRNTNGFTVSDDPSVPHILIGPGTGVAPFIGFLQYFERLKAEGNEVGQIWLFFGCRNEERDFIFRDQLEDFLDAGTLNHLCVCFSRQQIAPSDLHYSRKFCCPDDCKYVQHCLLAHRQQLTGLLVDCDARVLVCGDASGMSKDVLAAWPQVLVGNHPLTTSLKEADSFIASMRVQRRYLEDVWV